MRDCRKVSCALGSPPRDRGEPLPDDGHVTEEPDHSAKSLSEPLVALITDHPLSTAKKREVALLVRGLVRLLRDFGTIDEKPPRQRHTIRWATALPRIERGRAELSRGLYLKGLIQRCRRRCARGTMCRTRRTMPPPSQSEQCDDSAGLSPAASASPLHSF